jgi:CHAT domain-containing protein
MEYARQALDFAERSRSRSLLEQLFKNDVRKDAIIDRSVLSRDQELVGRLSEVRGQLALVRVSSFTSRDALYKLEEQRANLIAERIKLQVEINSSVGDGYRAAHLTPLTAEQVQRKLVEYYPNSVILYYQLGIRESFLVVLTTTGYYLVKLSDWTTISKAVTEWRDQISALQVSQQPDQAAAGYQRIAHRLYELLIKPVAHLIRHKELIIIPSDALSTLAFEGLVVNQTDSSSKAAPRPKYLVQDHVVSYAPSVSVLMELESRSQLARRSSEILLLGDASRENDTQIAMRGEVSGSDALDRLPAARQEVLKIAQLARQNGLRPTIWLGSEASEDKFKNTDLTPFRFIHIATHGVSDRQDGEASALTLSPGAGGQDGLLTSDEAAKLKLKSDLIVLSGCETGLGQKAGAEGIVGFNRNLLLAGTRCVCGSLWPVEDTWTEKLMTAFYKRFITGQFNKSKSLRLAKLDLLEQCANPSQWAAFTLVGTTR